MSPGESSSEEDVVDQSGEICEVNHRDRVGAGHVVYLLKEGNEEKVGVSGVVLVGSGVPEGKSQMWEG